MGLFERKKKPGIESLPKVLTQQDEPVNYTTVLDYLVGLSKPDYDKMLKVSAIYRDANKEVAKITGIKDEATTVLIAPKPTDDEIDDALDDTLAGNFLDDEPETPKPTKAQAPTKKIEVKE